MIVVHFVHKSVHVRDIILSKPWFSLERVHRLVCTDLLMYRNAYLFYAFLIKFHKKISLLANNQTRKGKPIFHRSINIDKCKS